MRAKSELFALVLLATLAAIELPSSFMQPLETLVAQDALQAQTNGHQTPAVLDDNRLTHGDVPPTLTDKQKKTLMGANLGKSRKDAVELAALARQLRDELDKPNVNTLSPDYMLRVEKIEKLAKKIRDELKMD
jgi:hypothetical protein